MFLDYHVFDNESLVKVLNQLIDALVEGLLGLMESPSLFHDVKFTEFGRNLGALLSFVSMVRLFAFRQQPFRLAFVVNDECPLVCILSRVVSQVLSH